VIASPKRGAGFAIRRTSSTVDVLAQRHLSSGNGGDGGHLMAKKDAGSKRLIRPKTTGDYLARLPQFEPRPIPFADFQEESPRGEPQEVGPQNTREKRIDDVLSKFMAPYIRDATKRQPFLKDAKRAIAAYEGARGTGYDRPDAKKLLTETLASLETTRRRLQEIDQFPELSSYLKRLHRDALGSGHLGPAERHLADATLSEQPQPSSPKQVKQELRGRASLDRNYSDFAPDQIVWCLSHLETVLSLAAEQVTFGPGDAQQDQIARDFTDQLASAWHSATERLPTYSRPTPRLKNCSPFARLLETINQEVLEKRHRSPNKFLEYGIKSVKRFRQLIGIRSVKRKSVKRLRR